MNLKSCQNTNHQNHILKSMNKKGGSMHEIKRRDFLRLSGAAAAFGMVGLILLSVS